MIALGGYDLLVRLWDVKQRKPIGELGPYKAPIQSIAFSPDGSIIAAGDDDRSIHLWNIAIGKTAATLKGHSRSVKSLAF